jgi:psp operon transcriptional activator
MNEDLLESELFGHEVGAFTGAAKRHKGRFERAEGGTLFLDEIASASGRVQEKLLRVIEYGEFERVGGEDTLSANVRVVAAANVDLRMRAREGKFRADLLDRLAFDVVAAPALRERREDIALLAAHFATAIMTELEGSFPGFSENALAQLQQHDWPGNVRELKNTAERAAFLWAVSNSEGQVDDIVIDPFEKAHGPLLETKAEAQIPANVASNLKVNPLTHAFDLRTHLDDIEKQLVSEALARHGGNQKRSAKSLSLTYDQMRGIIRKYGLNT